MLQIYSLQALNTKDNADRTLTEIQPKELFDLCVRTLTERTVSKFKGL